MNGAMSAIGTKRTSLVALHMSAFGGKADIGFCAAHLAFDPKRTCLTHSVPQTFVVRSAVSYSF